jgi:hypothetical protein
VVINRIILLFCTETHLLRLRRAPVDLCASDGHDFVIIKGVRWITDFVVTFFTRIAFTTKKSRTACQVEILRVSILLPRPET